MQRSLGSGRILRHRQTNRFHAAPRYGLAAMRHSSLELTMNVYTDPALLDVAGAAEAMASKDL